MIDFLFLPVCQITHISFLSEIYVTNIEIRYAVNIKSIAVVQKVSRLSHTAYTWVRSLVSLCEVCDRQGGSETGFSQNTLVYTSQYYSTDAAHSSVRLSSTL